MQHEEKIMSEFEKEMWLYMEESLPPQRMEYWRNAIRNHPEIQAMYEETSQFLDSYTSEVAPHLAEEKFKDIIETATSKKQDGYLQKLFGELFNTQPKSGFRYGKIAFASGLVIASIIVLLFLNKPIITNPNQDLLDWEGSQISNSLSKIDHSVYQLRNNSSVDYAIYSYTKDKWNTARTILEDQIKTIKSEINNKSF